MGVLLVCGCHLRQRDTEPGSCEHFADVFARSVEHKEHAEVGVYGCCWYVGVWAIWWYFLHAQENVGIQR